MIAGAARGVRRLDRRATSRTRSWPCSSSALAAGAALQVVFEVGRYVKRRAPGGLASGYVVGGFLAGLVVMYVTGLLAG